MLATDQREGGGLFTKLTGWWREMRRKRAAIDELDRCGVDAQQLASDVGLSAPELRVIAAKRPDSADLLKPRLVALGIDRASMLKEQPEVMRDLERVCTVCGDKSRCQHDLATNPADPRWREYCPNVHTLDALKDPSGETSPAPAGKADGGAAGPDSPVPALYHGFPVQRPRFGK